MAIREVNLIDPGILLRRHMQRHLAFWALCLLVTLALIGGSFLFQIHAAAAKKSGRGSLKQLYTNLELKIDEIKRLQAELETLGKRQDALEIIAQKQPFHNVLVKLAGIMNQYTWIQQLSLDVGKESASGMRVKLIGFAASNDHLGNFISSLSSEPMFKTVVLEFAKESAALPSDPGVNAGTNQVQFQINCDITRG